MGHRQSDRGTASPDSERPARDLLRDGGVRADGPNGGLFDQMAVGVGLIETATGRHVQVNQKYLQIVGYAELEMLGLTDEQLTADLDRPRKRAEMARLMSGEVRELRLEERLVRRDGSTVWVERTLWVVDEVSSSQHHIALIQDVTERRRAQASTLEAREELESTLAALPDLLFDIDEEGRFYHYRAPAPQLLAVPPETFLGRTASEVLPASAARKIEAAIQAAKETGRSTGIRYALDVRGSSRSFELSIARKPIDVDGLARFIAIARDVTDRVEAEAKQRSLEEKLRRSQKLEAVGTLAGGIAHDFNNLLTVIGLNVQRAHLTLDADHAAAPLLESVDVAVGHAERLIQQILAFSRAQSSAPTAVSVRAALAEASELLGATLPLGLKLVVRPCDEDLWVRADPTQLHQVLINLGGNARQALEGGTGTITLWARLASSSTEGGPRPIAIGVQDDGPGMSEAVLTRVFEPFFTTKPPGRGTGLGLSVVHGIVEEHGGTISVLSEPGEGTTFEVLLPSAEPTAQPTSSHPPERARNGARVVYVDDEPRLVVLVRELLADLGYRPTCFSAPREALQAIRSAPGAWDVVITDLTMPGLSGLELARALSEVRPDLPILLVSGYAPADLAQLSEAGITRVLPKPFDMAALDQALAEILAESSR